MVDFIIPDVECKVSRSKTVEWKSEKTRRRTIVVQIYLFLLYFFLLQKFLEFNWSQVQLVNGDELFDLVMQ